MALNNISTNENFLELAGETGSAISEPKVVTNVTSIKNITLDIKCRTMYNLTDSIPDTLKSYKEILDGDKLIIVKDDDSIYELTATGVTSVTENISLTPIMTGLTSPENEVISSSSSPTKWFIFDQTPNFFTMGLGAAWYGYKFDLPTVVTSISVEYASAYNPIMGLSIEASLDGTTWTTLLLDYTTQIAGAGAGINNFVFDYLNEIPYTYYKINHNGTVNIIEVKLMRLQAVYTVDTTAVTAGEIPTRSYLDKSKLFFNGTPCVHNNSTVTLGGLDGGLESLLIKNRFNDLAIPVATSLITSVEMGVRGNKITKIDAELFS